MTPSATIIIPCFNHGPFVREAVASALNQSDAQTRVILIDDGSTDGRTPADCDACATLPGADRLTILHQPNRGLPATRNRGASLATTDYLAFLDSDDWIEPAFVSRLASLLPIDSPDLSHAYCQERLVDKGVGIWRVPDWDPLLMMITNIHPVTCLVRRDRFEAVGGFNESMTGGYEDWDLWLKFVERGWRGVRLREPLFTWRRHSDSTMVMNVIHNHAALYERLRRQHADLYTRHALELIIRSNTMLRRFDMNWLDEDGRPINLCAMKNQKQMYESMLAVRLDRTLRRWASALRGRPPAPPAQLPRQ